jgi:hypothetical protein
MDINSLPLLVAAGTASPHAVQASKPLLGAIFSPTRMRLNRSLRYIVGGPDNRGLPGIWEMGSGPAKPLQRA